MAQSFTCPHGHTWEAPPTGVSLIGGQYVACPTCAALVRAEGKSTVEGTDPASAGKSAGSPPTAAELQATLLQAQLDTVRRLPAVQITEIGDYDILSELGRGGMGVVYRAKHRVLKRLAAVKMILAGEYASSESLRRFLAEAEAVARVQHPNIVQIYDIGQHDKKPYFAMEFCDGGSLHDRLDTPMPPRQAAQLMAQIAKGMHFAHQQGIIHRDLKPANILLARDNTPKVTDFGLAKKLDEEKGRTRTGDVLGTPSYMAPEQAEGKIKEIGPHTDVYALGAILYEMLTARQAFQAETAMDTLFQVLYEEPVAPARLVPRIPRDLEIICLKCLSKEIGKRYLNAEELAQDLERFLEGSPIVARPAGALEKTVKWARRRPALASLIAVSGLAVVAGLALSLYFNVELSRLNLALEQAAAGERQKAEDARKAEEKAKAAQQVAEKEKAAAVLAQQQAETQRQRAEANFQKARAAVQSMLTEVGQSELAYVPLMEEVRRKLLTEAMQFNKDFLAQKGDDPEIRHQAALSHQHLADIHKMLGDYAEGDQENQEAIRQLQALANLKSPRQADYRADLAASYFHRGQLFRDQSRYADALAAYESAREIRAGLADQHPERPEFRRALGRTYTDVGQALRYTNRPEDAARSFEQALAIHRKLVQEHPDEPDFRDGLGGTLNDLGALLRAGRKPAEARQAYEQALEQFAEMARRWPSKPEFRQKQAATRNNLGNVFLDLQDAPEAINILKQALAERQKLVDQFPSVLVYRQDLAFTHNNLAAALSFPSVGQLPEAEKEYAEAIKIQRRLVDDLPRFPDFRSQLGGTLDNLASLVSRQGDTAKARQLLDEALTHHEAARQSNPDQPLYRLFLRNHYSTLANVQLRAKAHAEAAAAIAQMLRLKTDGPDDSFRAAVLLSRCAALVGKDSPALAQKYGADAVGQLREAVKLGLPDTEPIKTAAEFNPLRNRDDFKQLLGELK